MASESARMRKSVSVRDCKVAAIAAGGATVFLLAAAAFVFAERSARPTPRPRPEPEHEHEHEPVDAATAFEIRSSIRRKVLERVVRFALFTAAATAYVGYMFWTSLPDRRRQHIHLAEPGTWWPQLHQVVSGRISAEQSLAIVLAMLALNATINVALAIPQSQSHLRDQVANVEWRRGSTAVAFIAAGVGVFAGICAWLGPTVRSTSAISALADVAAALCVLLAVSIVQAADNAAEREMNRAQACTENHQLQARRDLLALPDNAGLGTSSPAQAAWIASKATVGQLATITFVTALVSLAALLGIAWLYYHDPWHPEWSWFEGFALLWGIAAVVAVITCWFSFQRWSTHRTKRPKLQVYAYSWTLRVIYVTVMLMVPITAPTDNADAVASNTMIAVLTVGLPITLWAILGWTRKRRQPKWLSWLASPLWTAVAVSLNRRQAELRNRIV